MSEKKLSRSDKIKANIAASKARFVATDLKSYEEFTIRLVKDKVKRQGVLAVKIYSVVRKLLKSLLNDSYVMQLSFKKKLLNGLLENTNTNYDKILGDIRYYVASFLIRAVDKWNEESTALTVFTLALGLSTITSNAVSAKLLLDELENHRASFVSDTTIQTLRRVLKSDYKSDPKSFFDSKLKFIGSTPEEFAMNLELENGEISSSETASSVPNGKQSKSVTFEQTNGVNGYDEWDGFDVSPYSDQPNNKSKVTLQKADPFYETKGSSTDEWGSGSFDETNGETSEDVVSSAQTSESEVGNFGDETSESDWGESGFDESIRSNATETDGMTSDDAEGNLSDNGFSEDGNLDLF